MKIEKVLVDNNLRIAMALKESSHTYILQLELLYETQT